MAATLLGQYIDRGTQVRSACELAFVLPSSHIAASTLTSLARQSILLGLSFTLPHFNNVFFSMLVASKGSPGCFTCNCMDVSLSFIFVEPSRPFSHAHTGAYSVIKGLLWTKVLLAAAMLLAGPSSALLLCVFVASNRIFTEVRRRVLGARLSQLTVHFCEM